VKKSSDRKSRTAWSHQTLFTRGFFSIYDWFALGFQCRWVWQCPVSRIVDLYNRHVSGNHLDLAVGTGYFLDKCRFPISHPRLVLLDINPRSLEVAQKRLKRYHPHLYQKNILEPVNLNTEGFDSIGLTHLIHCLPGTLENKDPAFKNIYNLLNSGGTAFGTTFLYQGIQRGLWANLTFEWANRAGFMSNK
jgi:ubiquinone/menaquinone biosynthesis C-methylase UbiE